MWKEKEYKSINHTECKYLTIHTDALPNLMTYQLDINEIFVNATSQSSQQTWKGWSEAL